MGRSIVVDVRRAVIEALAQELKGPFPGLSCSYGWLGGSDDKRRQQVYTNRPRATHEPASLKAGPTFRNERMEFDVIVMVQDPMLAAEDLDEVVMDIVQVIEELIADNKGGENFGIFGLNWIKVSRFEMENRIAGQGVTGSVTLASLTLEYDARLT